MSALEIVGLIFAVLLGVTLLRIALLVALKKIQTWAVAKAEYCEMCKRRPRAFICNTTSLPPFNMCQVCCENEIRPGFMREEWLKTGKLVRATSVAAKEGV